MGAPLSKSTSASSSLTLSAHQRHDLVTFVRRTLGSSLHYGLRLWIYVTGLEGHEALVRKLFLQFKYRANNTASAYHCMAMTLVELWLRTLRVVLVPDVFIRFLCATFVLHIFYEMKSLARGLIASALLQLTTRGRRQARLSRMLTQAKSFQERQTIAGELDKIEGKDRWRENPASGLYLYERVLNKTQMYKRLQLDNDIVGLMFALRAGLLRKHWGLGNPRLYSVSHVGTKHVIEEYLDTIVQSMNAVLRATPSALAHNDAIDDELSIDNKLAFFSETRHAFGRSALLLSGGGALGFYHAGVVKALNENNLLPNVIAGSSAGSIVAGIVGVRTDEEISAFFADQHIDLNFLSVNLTPQDYAKFTPTIALALEKVLPKSVYLLVRDVLVLATRYASKGYLLDGEVLGATLRKYIGDYTFREAYDRTGRIINITVTPLKTDDYPHLLNYLTAPNVLIWSASVASCAIPNVFKPVELLAKDKHGNSVPYFREGLKWSDGSIECDLPMERLSELFNVNHFIASQVNIHYKVVSGHSAFGFGQTGSLLSFLKKQMKGYIRDIAELGLNTSVLKFLDFGLIPLLTQKYEGDITICPTDEFALHYLLRTSLSNPTKDTFQHIIAAGERACWPHVARIRTMCRIEFALERAVRYLRGEQAIQDEREHGRKAIGRVPSFYTSPSSMNLASLDQPAGSVSPASSRSRSYDAEDPTTVSNPQGLRRNRSMNVAGAVMTMEMAAARPTASRFGEMEG